MSTFNPGDTLTISTASYKGRRFTVLESNGHRTKLRGSKGAHRVLVAHNRHRTEHGADLPPTTYSIHEDDGEKNRGRPCTVDEVERAPADVTTSPAEPFKVTSGTVTLSIGKPVVQATREQQIRAECDAIADMLIAKNRDYGDSALSPVRIFSKADPAAGLRVRIDDKLSRLARGNDAGEDTVKDLLGYLVLLRIAEGET